MAENRLKALLEQQEEGEQAGSSRLKSLVDEKPRGFWADFGQGAKSPINFLGEAFSGDPEMRGYPAVAETPDTLGGRMGQVASESAALATPIGAAARTVKPAAQGVGKIRQILQDAVSGVGRSYQASPKKFVAAEAGLGGAAGAGGFYANEMFPDSEAARFIGEVMGGSAPAAAAATGRGVVRSADWLAQQTPIARSVRNFTANTWNEVARTMNSTTAGSRASERFQRATDESPEQIVQGIDNADVMPEAREIMTPAQLSGNPGLLSLERSVINESDQLKNKSAEQLERLNNVILSGMRGAVGEEAAREGAERTFRDYTSLLNERVRIAAQQADESIEKMFPLSSAEDANRIARRKLQGALDDALKQERQLWDKVDQDAITPTGNTQARLRELQREVGVAGSDSIPTYVKNLFSRDGRRFLGSLTSVREMRQAQSQLRNIARNNRKGADPDFNMARIADQMADAITEDLALSQGANADLISEAVNFSRQKNEVFRQGAVGRVLRTGADSGDVIPESLTLTETLGRSGGKGGQAADDILAAADTPEMREAMDSFVKDEFMRAAIRDGEINPTAANTFLRNNKEVLDRFPEIRTNIEQAINSGNTLEATRALRKEGIKSLDDPKVAKASLLINEGPIKAFESVLSSRSPRSETRNLIDLVGEGEAFEGLQQGFMDFLAEKATRRGVISGEALSDVITSRNGRAVILELFNEDQARRIFQIANTARRADAARAAKGSVEGVTGDSLGQATEALLGVMGAAYGREVSTRLGGGTVQIPGIFANKFRQLGVAGLVNPAKRLIVDAIMDEKLFKQVLMAKDPENLGPEATKLLNAWAYGAAGRALSDDEENLTEQQVN